MTTWFLSSDCSNLGGPRHTGLPALGTLEPAGESAAGAQDSCSVSPLPALRLRDPDYPLLHRPLQPQDLPTHCPLCWECLSFLQVVGSLLGLPKHCFPQGFCAQWGRDRFRPINGW